MKKLLVIISVLIVACVLTTAYLLAEDQGNIYTSNFNQSWLKAIISIEVIEKNDQDETEKHPPVGTGFLILSENKHLILVTAKHVIIDRDGTIKKNLAYRLNDKKGDSLLVREEELTQRPVGTWFISSNADLACRFIIFSETSDLSAIPKDEFLEENSFQVGAPILLLGFPLGLRSERYALPIARSGIISRYDSGALIIDVDFYPGNSGGPIIYVPTFKIGKGLTNALINKEKLAGLAIEFISYVDTAVSLQTKRPRVSFEENSGLCIAVPANIIFAFLNREDIIDLDNKLNKLFVEENKE